MDMIEATMCDIITRDMSEERARLIGERESRKAAESNRITANEDVIRRAGKDAVTYLRRLWSN